MLTVFAFMSCDMVVDDILLLLLTNGTSEVEDFFNLCECNSTASYTFEFDLYIVTHRKIMIM